jgi:WXG100 family type VII secretion target
MGIINVSADDLRTLSILYQQEAQELRTRADQLLERTEPLVRDWIGASSSAFQATARDVDSRQRELISTLEKMAQFLASAADAFESLNDNISSAFQ